MSVAWESAGRDLLAAELVLDERIAFIRRVYAHVGGAVLVLVGLVGGVLNTPALAAPLNGLASAQPWLLLIAFLAASLVAHRLAESGASSGVQYLGLGLYVTAEAFFFAPFLSLLQQRMPGADHLILQAGLLTLIIFGGLTAVVLLTRADFSFLRNVLALGMLAALGLIVVSLFTTISLGTWFSAGVVVLMSGFLLYETSNVLHHYPSRAHVAAALAVFASLTTLFWYVLRLMAALSDD